MRTIILQYSTPEQQAMLDTVMKINKPYANKFGIEYYVDGKRRCKERSIYWEKIAYLKEFLPTVEDGSLIIWVDADSLIVGDEDIRAILPPNTNFGMVQMRGGLGGKQLFNWYNAGLLAMRNTKDVRDFLDRVWDRADENDEASINAELKHTGGFIGSLPLAKVDIKWNCWSNNIEFCKNPMIRSFHGILSKEKLPAIKKFMNS